MKRDPALVSLARDHHQALFVARKLRRARAETASEARAAFLSYWEEHGRAHFRLEEDVLLPAYAGYGDPITRSSPACSAISSPSDTGPTGSLVTAL